MHDSNSQDLIESIKSLVVVNKKLSSLKNNFFRGIIFGVGSAIGASVVAAIALGILNKFFQSIKNISP